MLSCNCTTGTLLDSNLRYKYITVVGKIFVITSALERCKRKIQLGPHLKKYVLLQLNREIVYNKSNDVFLRRLNCILLLHFKPCLVIH